MMGSWQYMLETVEQGTAGAVKQTTNAYYSHWTIVPDMVRFLVTIDK